MLQKDREQREFSINSMLTVQLQLQSETQVKRMLQHIHPGASSASLYDHAAKVAASARQAAAFEKSEHLVGEAVQPLIRYYTVLHWMKTLLFLCDLSFPSSTSVLQHGISVRRVKRQPYKWPLETVYVHKDGVLQSFLQLVASTPSPLASKLVVGDLLGGLPRLAPDIAVSYPSFQHVYVVERSTDLNDDHLYVSRKIAANIQQTVAQWKKDFVQATRVGFQEDSRDQERTRSSETSLSEDPPGFLQLPTSIMGHPWATVCDNQWYVFDKSPTLAWVSHFVILYTLSALCRYNPLEWSDVLTWNNETDSFLVRSYLTKYPIQEVVQLLYRAVGVQWCE